MQPGHDCGRWHPSGLCREHPWRMCLSGICSEDFGSSPTHSSIDMRAGIVMIPAFTSMLEVHSNHAWQPCIFATQRMIKPGAAQTAKLRLLIFWNFLNTMLRYRANNTRPCLFNSALRPLRFLCRTGADEELKSQAATGLHSPHAVMQRGRAGWVAHLRARNWVERVLAGAVVVVRPHDAARIRWRCGVAAAHARLPRPAVARLGPAHEQLHVRGVQQAPASARSGLAVSLKQNLLRSCLISMSLRQGTWGGSMRVCLPAKQALLLHSKECGGGRDMHHSAKVIYVPCLYARFCMGASGQNTMLSVLRGSWSLMVPSLVRRSMTRPRSGLNCACRATACRKSRKRVWHRPHGLCGLCRDNRT